MAITQVIAEEQISQVAFTELADSILQSMVTQTGGAFETVMDKFETYLDQTEIDEVQKQGAYAQFMKDVYNDINKQALTSAMDLLKSNAQLSYEKWKVEADYNAALAGIAKAQEELGLVALTNSKMTKENELLEKQKAMTDAQLLEQRAKLKKQYGVLETMTYTLGDGASTYKQFTDSLWYKINVDGAYVTAANEVTATPNTNGIPATITSMAMTTDVVNTITPGAIDKQILGYDYVNYKDVLKTMDERAALMQNAKVPENANEKMARLALIKALTTNVSGMPITLS